MIAASIPITVPAFRWIGEKLLDLRYVIAPWTALSKRGQGVGTASRGGDQITLIMTSPQK